MARLNPESYVRDVIGDVAHGLPFVIARAYDMGRSMLGTLSMLRAKHHLKPFHNMKQALETVWSEKDIEKYLTGLENLREELLHILELELWYVFMTADPIQFAKSQYLVIGTHG